VIGCCLGNGLVARWADALLWLDLARKRRLLHKVRLHHCAQTSTVVWHRRVPTFQAVKERMQRLHVLLGEHADSLVAPRKLGHVLDEHVHLWRQGSLWKALHKE
jgi:hypothetical protein